MFKEVHIVACFKSIQTLMRAARFLTIVMSVLNKSRAIESDYVYGY